MEEDDANEGDGSAVASRSVGSRSVEGSHVVVSCCILISHLPLLCV